MNQTFLEKVIDQFADTATSQEKKGIEKYGHELQPMDPKWDWLAMAKEEFVDGFKYLAAEQERRNELIKEIKFKIIGAMNHNTSAAVNLYLTEALEGLKRLRGE
jgi:hypothetical protein